MYSPDVFEAYVNNSMPKDFHFISLVKFPKIDDPKSQEIFKEYYVLKKRLSEFSSDKNLINLYDENPLDSINSEILKKDMQLIYSLDSRLLDLKDDVEKYSGSSKRKVLDVTCEMEFLSSIYYFTGSNVSFDVVKKNINNSIISKVYGTKHNSFVDSSNIKDKSSSKYSYSNLKFLARNVAFIGLLGFSMYLGSHFFSKEKEVYTTIDPYMYESKSISLQEKINQFVTDRNLLLNYESSLFQDVLDENKLLQKKSIKGD